MADRMGRLEDRPRYIQIVVLPYFRCDVNDLLSQLTRLGYLIRYEADDKKYIAITKWEKFQKPHRSEPASLIPPPPGYPPDPELGPPITQAMRRKIFTRDDFTCRWCGSQTNLAVDHVHPLSKGGTNYEENLQTLCKKCNSKKSNRIIAINDGLS